MIWEKNFELRLLYYLRCMAFVRRCTAELYREATRARARTHAHTRARICGYPYCIYLFEEMKSLIISFVIVRVAYML